MFAKLRIAEGGFLGLRAHPCPCIAAALVVVHIEERGAVAAWNRILEADDTRRIFVGDVILEVNGHRGSAHMFVALSSAVIVSLTLTRHFSLWHAELGVTMSVCGASDSGSEQDEAWPAAAYTIAVAAVVPFIVVCVTICIRVTGVAAILVAIAVSVIAPIVSTILSILTHVRAVQLQSLSLIHI